MITTNDSFKNIYIFDYDVIQMFYINIVKIQFEIKIEITLIAYVRDQYYNADTGTQSNYNFLLDKSLNKIIVLESNQIQTTIFNVIYFKIIDNYIFYTKIVFKL